MSIYSVLRSVWRDMENTLNLLKDQLVIEPGDIAQMIGWFVNSLGYFMIFIKCGVFPLWGFIPFVREYQISRCADREKEGRTFAVLSVVSGVIALIRMQFPEESTGRMVVAVLILAAYLAIMLYQVRIYSGLCQVFGRKKKWLWAWFLIEPITSLIWGFNKDFVPGKKVEKRDKNAGARLSGCDAEKIDTGLTINIQRRSIIDFFKRKDLLKDIHLGIPEGHMVLLLGGSGAGKTTFVNAITGYEQAKASILLKDHDLYKEYGSMKYDVGFVPQQDLMRSYDTVIRTLSDAAALRLPKTMHALDRKKRVHEVLEEFGLAAISGSMVEKLSGGQRKRLSIAMEYISDPSLFVLDEPDSGLDGVVARGLFEKLRSIADSGKIVVVITHTPDRVIDLFDDVIVLAKDSARTGRLAYYGPVKDAYDFFGKQSMEEILLSVNQKDEGGEGRADEFVVKYSEITAESEKKAG